MNANPIRIGTFILFALLACRFSAFGLDSQYPFFVDPLGARPDVLEKGVVLPGDQAPAGCPEKKDISESLALGEAVDLALCNNPQIKSAWANIKVQAGAVGEARAAYLPTLNGSVGRTHDRISYPDSNYPVSSVDRSTFQGGLNWRLFDFGGRAANRRAAQNMLTAALAYHNATVQKILSDVTQAYFDAMTAKATLQAAKESGAIANMTLESAQARIGKGVISQSDLLRATAALAKAALEYNRSQGNYQKALAVLRNILGVSDNTVISMPGELDEDAVKTGKDLHLWLEEARKNHPAITAARAQIEAAQNRVKIARSAGLPTLNFAGNYYMNTRPGEAVTADDTRELTLAVMLSIPFFDGFANTYKIRGAQAQVEQKEAELDDTEKKIALELIRAYTDTTFAFQNLDASATLLNAARESLTVSQRRYDKGAADITEILSTQATLSNAQQERIRCLSEWHSARLRLLASAGQMGRAAVTEAKSSPPVENKHPPLKSDADEKPALPAGTQPTPPLKD